MCLENIVVHVVTGKHSPSFSIACQQPAHNAIKETAGNETLCTRILQSTYGTLVMEAVNKLWNYLQAHLVLPLLPGVLLYALAIDTQLASRRAAMGVLIAQARISSPPGIHSGADMHNLAHRHPHT